MADGRDFAWLGGSGVAWNSAANWQDLTTAAAATVAPGARDKVSIVGNATPLVVTGAGAAAAAATHLSVLLDGAFQFGTLDVEGTLTLAGAGSTLAVGNLGEAGAAGPSLLVANATSLTVAGRAVFGSASLTDAAWVQLGGSATVSGGLDLDASSCVEVGSGGTFWPSWLKVYADGTFSGTGQISANTVVEGVINAAGLSFGGFLGGSGTIRLLAGGATVGTVFQDVHLLFDTPGASLAIAPGAIQAMAGALVGFAAGDALDLQEVAGASARFAATDAGSGFILVADRSGAALGRFAVTGDAASLARGSFLTVPDGSGGTLLINLAAATAGTPSPGNTTPHRTSWLGGSGGAWNSAANWQDLTTAAAATVAPGARDKVSIVGNATPLVVTGAGAAAAAATHLSVLLDGAFQFGTLDVEGTLTLAGAGSTLAVGNLGEAGAAGPSLLVANATSLTVAGRAVFGSASLTDAAWVQLGGSATVSGGLDLDASSCVEVGSGGTFWPSWLKVYADGTFSGTGQISANTVVEGVINAAGLSFGGFLGGSGTIRLLAGGATVGTVFQDVHLLFDTPGASLAIAPGAIQAMAGALVGFAAGDALDLQEVAGASARFAATDAGSGFILVADRSGAALGRFAVTGDAASLARGSFLTVPDGSGGTLLINLAAATAGTPSPGNTTPHRTSWLGGSGGAWNSAANWQDLTTAAAATVAPGARDKVSIVGNATPLVVTGAGAAAAAATHLSVLLDGAFQFGTLDVEGTLTLAGAGSTLAVGNLGEAGAAGPSLLVANATSLTVAGRAVFGSASLTDAAWVQLGGSATVSGGLDLDASSCVEVGSGGTFWPSWLKVYADGTFSGTGQISANTVVEGVINAAGLSFGGFLGGSGTIRLLAGGATVGTVFQDVHLLFDTPGASLAIAPGATRAMAGALVDVSAGDALDLQGVAGAEATFSAIDASRGILTVTDAAGAPVGSFSLFGDTTALTLASFLPVADGTGGTLLIDLAPVTDAPTEPGNATPHSYSWVGAPGAAWNIAANWHDFTPGNALAVAPGTGDSVSITGHVTPLLITGSGAAASVATQRSVLLDGVFGFESLDVAGTLTVAGLGSRLSLHTLGAAGAVTPPALVLNASSLTVSGDAVLGRADVAAGSWARLGPTANMSNALTIDASSCVEVGSGGTFWPSWLKVYADGTFSGTGQISANTVVEGRLDASGLRFGGFLGGSGSVRILAGGATVGTVFAGMHLAFSPAAGALAIAAGSIAAMTGSLVGFAAGNTIDLLGQAAATARFAALDATHGVLSIAGAAGNVLGTFTLEGDASAYGRAAFQIRADGAGGSLITETAAPGTQPMLTHPS